MKNDKENLNVSELVKAQGTASAKGKSIISVMNDMMKKSLEQQTAPARKLPMIKIKHRWMKHRNLMSNNTVVSFGKDGIAYVEDVGNARLDVDLLIKKSNGLISYYKEGKVNDDKEVSIEKVISAPVVEAPKEEPKEEKKEEPKKEAEAPSVEKKEVAEAKPEDDTIKKPAKEPPAKQAPKKKLPPRKG